MYSISPEFLKFKIEDSLKTLDLDCLDLVILDDPVFNFLDTHEVFNHPTIFFIILNYQILDLSNN